jgi:hypothetical protein
MKPITRRTARNAHHSPTNNTRGSQTEVVEQVSVRDIIPK